MTGRSMEVALGCNSLRRLLDCSKRAVPFRNRERYSTATLDARAGDFRLYVLEAFRNHHLDPMRRPRHRVLDRLRMRFQDARDRDLRGTSIHVEPHLDRGEDRRLKAVPALVMKANQPRRTQARRIGAGVNKDQDG
jgi:hypothetical protein